ILFALNSTLLPLLFLAKAKTLLMMALLISIEYLCIFAFGESSRPTILEFFVDGEWLLICLLLKGAGVI
ncbi:MAG: hypothetical protein LUO92_02390, partial [Methanothrix sp.]|nr:hypothetical protein [Methanothrix sp.]